MNSEDSKNSQHKNGDRIVSAAQRCPLIKVLDTNEHGIVVQSRSSFEIGSAFALGIHVQIPESRQTEFVSAETMIVESTPRFNRRGDRVYQVTMIYSEISHADRDLLLLVSHDESMVAPPASPNPAAASKSPLARRAVKCFASLN